jgi:hypothetical protein
MRFNERAIIRIIHINQKIFIDKKLEDWVHAQEINWNWSMKNTFEQNKKFRVMIDWHHSLIWWHHSSNTLTFVSHIRKESFVKQKSLHFLHALCIRNAFEVLQYKDFVDLLSWSSAFDFYKYDSKRAIFNVDYQVWNESFLKLLKSWDLMFSTNEH